MNEKKDLRTLFPELAKQWNELKNHETSESVKPGSNKKVWWKCDKGHSWEATVKNRAAGSGCPYCSGRLPIKGENDLATIRPDLITEWDTKLNITIDPSEVTEHSNKKVWWKCFNNHSWQATINSRANGSGCPYCKGRRRLSDNDTKVLPWFLPTESDQERFNIPYPDIIINEGRKMSVLRDEAQLLIPICKDDLEHNLKNVLKIVDIMFKFSTSQNLKTDKVIALFKSLDGVFYLISSNRFLDGENGMGAYKSTSEVQVDRVVSVLNGFMEYCDKFIYFEEVSNGLWKIVDWNIRLA